MMISKPKVLAAFTLSYFFVTSVIASPVAALNTVKEAVDVYQFGQAVKAQPEKIVALKINIERLFEGEAGYPGLTQELMIKADVIDADEKRYFVRAIDVDEQPEMGYQLVVFGVDETGCNYIMNSMKKTSFFDEVFIFDRDDKEVESCQPNAWGYQKNNTMVLQMNH